jgi:carbon storage regulator
MGLTLSRRKEDTIEIGDKITIKVVEIVGGRVRLLITAPAEIDIQRGEVADAIRRDGPIREPR